MNNQSKIIRWGILGCGNVTEVKSGPAYQKTLGFEVVAVMRRDALKAADYAKRHGIREFYTDADALINDPEVDAVYIATPPDVHKFYGLKVAQAGKICCIEKPLAPCYQDSLAIYQAFQANDIPLFVAYYRRTLPRFVQIKNWLDAAAIGTLRHISWHLSKPANEMDLSGGYNWRTDARVASGGYFDDLASHGLDLFTYWLGNISSVSGHARNQQGLYTAQDAIVASWVHESGVTGVGSWNFGCLERDDQVTIYGSHGKIQCAIFEDVPIEITTEEGTKSLFIPNPQHVQAPHVHAIHLSLFENMQHPSTAKTALHTSWVMDQILG